MVVSEPLLTNKDLELQPRDGNRYELIKGQLHVSIVPELMHQRTMGDLLFALMCYLDSNPIGEVLATPGVILSDYDGVIPDLVYLSNERRDEVATGTRIYGAPNLVIEILSPGVQNMERDRKVKLRLYESALRVNDAFICLFPCVIRSLPLAVLTRALVLAELG